MSQLPENSVVSAILELIDAHPELDPTVAAIWRQMIPKAFQILDECCFLDDLRTDISSGVNTDGSCWLTVQGKKFTGRTAALARRAAVTAILEAA